MANAKKCDICGDIMIAVIAQTIVLYFNMMLKVNIILSLVSHTTVVLNA